MMTEESGELSAVFNATCRMGDLALSQWNKQDSLSAQQEIDVTWETGRTYPRACRLGKSKAQVWLLRTLDSKALCVSQESLSKADR